MITRQQRSAIFMAVMVALGLIVPNFSNAFTSGETSPNELTLSIFDFLSDQEKQELTIVTDLTELIDNRKTEEYQPATLTYVGDNGEEVTQDISVKARGKYRRRVCNFPPIKIKFAKKDLAVAGFNQEFNKLKLVTHCLDGKFEGNENVLKEYLLYKMYNEITPESYRVKLVKINYIDSKGRVGKIKRFAFVIESTSQMAFRLGGTECECMNPNPNDLVASSENRVALFQFMIGNEDWNLMLNRNLKLVRPFDGGKMIVVPYDFDFSGAVFTSYALPSRDLGLSSVRDRFFQGAPVSDVIFNENVQLFKDKQVNLSEVILDFSPLIRTTRLELLEYIDGFYNYINQLSVNKPDTLHLQLKNTINENIGSR